MYGWWYEWNLKFSFDYVSFFLLEFFFLLSFVSLISFVCMFFSSHMWRYVYCWLCLVFYFVLQCMIITWMLFPLILSIGLNDESRLLLFYVILCLLCCWMYMCYSQKHHSFHYRNNLSQLTLSILHHPLVTTNRKSFTH